MEAVEIGSGAWYAVMLMAGVAAGVVYAMARSIFRRGDDDERRR